ncbi:APC family permease [Clostridium sp. Marseille-P299]|uniref:APC family permease n=1 Tax=Clostridium sp. Marseille-P299 TaxID=1805477 RepID=UPI00082B76C5|nr:APC family permease [Clostridium sp. Marseille-P299]
MQEKKYGLFTSITMITGIVIGSGIFFKSDDVLTYTNGNMTLGILVFLLAAVVIIFGSLSVSLLASRSDKAGGIISYAEEFVSANCAGAFGWFQVFLYLSPLVAVVAWVSGIYLCQIFNIPSTNENTTLIGFLVFCLLYLMNILSSALGGHFQNASMIIKLIPLAIIAVVGVIFGEPVSIIKHDFETVGQTVGSTNLLAAFAPIAFSYDGWIIATSICHKIRNSKRNLPLALSISPIIILIIYISYFVGVTSLVGVDTVLKTGNESAFLAANKIFGAIGAKLIIVFVIISVLGTLNGLILAYIQMPYSLAIRNMIPFSNTLKKESSKLNGMPVNSAIFGFFISCIWLIINYLMQKGGLPGDASEIPICINYANFIVLYIAVIRLTKKKEIKSKMMGYVAPVIASIGSFVIFTASFSHPLFWGYFIFSAIILLGGYFYTKRYAI